MVEKPLLCSEMEIFDLHGYDHIKKVLHLLLMQRYNLLVDGIKRLNPYDFLKTLQFFSLLFSL